MRRFFIDEDVQAGVSEWGDRSKETIICFHGLGSTSLSFIEIGEILKDKYHILSIDMPGHGRTPPFVSDDDYKMPNINKWLNKVFSCLDVNEFYLLAHSWGAHVGIYYIAENLKRVKKAILLDGGYHIKQDIFKYNALNGNNIDSLQKEIEYYYCDFNDYCFETIQEHIDIEKSNYLRWSPLLEEAARDLVIVENGKVRYHTNGYTARGILKSMYDFPPSLIYDRLPNNILLLQSTLPSEMNEIMDLNVKKFKYDTNAAVKKIEMASHLVHWDKPQEVVNEIVGWLI